ncbi:MAG: FliM/FliN family flagellar motor switch protein [Phycisphaerales bacterium]|nr:FliM/FliN family flagellar motor switch protein [Phycisphaerales bacterium]
MNLTQDEIDALLRSSDVTGPPADKRPCGGGKSGAKPRLTGDPSRWSYILHLSVPLVVRVAQRQMKLRQVLEISTGSILEFDTPAESELDLLVNNCPVAKGLAVKVGENFGLRLTRLLPADSQAG